MKKFIFVFVIFLSSVAVMSFFLARKNEKVEMTHTPLPVTEPNLTSPVDDPFGLLGWKRPDGPLRVGVQAGHWKYTEVPDELEGVRNNGGTVSRSGVPEWKVNLAIAEEIAAILRSQNIEVDILPATIPPNYFADAFISIHADGSEYTQTSGFKVASPRRDMTEKADDLALLVEEVYAQITGLPQDPNITRSMTGYYAFSWRRYEHTIHPMTPAVIIETGFLTNSKDALMLINKPELPASAIAEATIQFLHSNVLSSRF